MTFKACAVVVVSLVLVAAMFPPVVSGGTQIQVGLGDGRFFLGERFLITFKDVIYWVAGVCMGLLFASTFLFLSDGQLYLEKSIASNRDDQEEEEEVNSSRRGSGARLVGLSKYPTRMQQRILNAIHTEPENHINKRQARMVEQLKELQLESPAENSLFTTQEEVHQQRENSDSESAVWKLFKILFGLEGMTDDRSSAEQGNTL